MYPVNRRAQSRVYSVAVSHDGQWVVSGSDDEGVQFWDAKSGIVQLMLKGHKHAGSLSIIDYPRGCSEHLGLTALPFQSTQLTSALLGDFWRLIREINTPASVSLVLSISLDLLTRCLF